MLYFPIAVVVTCIFTVSNAFYVPIAWLKHLLALIGTLTSSSELLDEWSEKFVRFKTVVLFLIFGLVILTLSLPIDSYVFFYNLYTIPAKEYEEEDLDDLVTAKELEIMQTSCAETLLAQKNVRGRNSTSKKINYVTINKALQKQF
jgi:hypothetical protein